MIPIARTVEADACASLIGVRNDELDRVRKALDQGALLDEKLIGKNYGVARKSLYEMQAYKCCYCEVKPNSERWRHVEHFRPKLEARRSDGSTDTGYWWLTWTWNNLLFVCMDCNSAKHSKFPLDDGSMPLSPEEEPPGGEVALLIDPAVEDPRKHLQFRPVSGRWIPGYRSDRGKVMLDALEWVDESGSFKQVGLVDSWQWHVEGMQDLIATLRSAFATPDPDVIAAIWARTGRFRRASAPFVALSLDVLEYHFGDEIQHYRLDLSILRG